LINYVVNIHRNHLNFIFILYKIIFISRTIENRELDELILKFIIRFRNNGGFFIALKERQYHRQHLLHRLANSILLNKEYVHQTNLTPSDIHS
jgi:hypothetical protein